MWKIDSNGSELKSEVEEFDSRKVNLDIINKADLILNQIAKENKQKEIKYASVYNSPRNSQKIQTLIANPITS